MAEEQEEKKDKSLGDYVDDARNAKRGFDFAKNLAKGPGPAGAGGTAGTGAAGATGGAGAVTGAGGTAAAGSGLAAGGTGMAAAGGGAAATGAAAAGGAAAGAGATASAPVWVPVVVVAVVIIIVIVLIVIFVSALCGPLGICGSAGTAEAADNGSGDGTIPGGTIELVDDFCQNGGTPPCSETFKTLIESAATWAKMPAGVLVAVGLVEYSPVYDMLDLEIQNYLLPGVPLIDPGTGACPENPVAVSTGEHARGPMQFIFSTWSGNSYQYGNAAVEAGVRPSSYTGEQCNLLDSYYAAAKYLKLSSGIPFNELRLPWTRDNLANALSAYGTCSGGSLDDFNTCVDGRYALYLAKSNTVVGDGTNPTGWPASGTNNQTAYCIYEIANGIGCTSHANLSGVDIGTAGRIYASQGGILETGDTGDGSPCPNPRTFYGCAGHYALIKGSNYNTMYMHLRREPEWASPCYVNGATVKAGTFLGWAGNTGNSQGIHLHYEVRNSDDSLIARDLVALNNAFPPGWNELGAFLSSSYAGENCF